MAKLPGADLFCTYEPYHLVGREVFGSLNYKADVFFGLEGKSHWPDKVNFSCLQIAIRSAGANHASCSLADVAEQLSLDLQEDHTPNNLGTMVEVYRPPHVTAI
jgi:hypothetical protein